MNINTSVMDLKADIKWIQKELKDVKDPTLIEAFKNLLQYRKKVIGSTYETSKEHKAILDKRLADHKIDPKSGRSWEEVKADLRTKYGA